MPSPRYGWSQTGCGAWRRSRRGRHTGRASSTRRCTWRVILSAAPYPPLTLQVVSAARAVRCVQCFSRASRACARDFGSHPQVRLIIPAAAILRRAHAISGGAARHRGRTGDARALLREANIAMVLSAGDVVPQPGAVGGELCSALGGGGGAQAAQRRRGGGAAAVTATAGHGAGMSARWLTTGDDAAGTARVKGGSYATTFMESGRSPLPRALVDAGRLTRTALEDPSRPLVNCASVYLGGVEFDADMALTFARHYFVITFAERLTRTHQVPACRAPQTKSRDRHYRISDPSATRRTAPNQTSRHLLRLKSRTSVTRRSRSWRHYTIS